MVLAVRCGSCISQLAGNCALPYACLRSRCIQFKSHLSANFKSLKLPVVIVNRDCRSLAHARTMWTKATMLALAISVACAVVAARAACTCRGCTLASDNNDTRVIATHLWHASMHAQHALSARMSHDPPLHPRAPLAAYAASHRLTHLACAPRRPRCGAQCACAMLGSHLSTLRVNPPIRVITSY